MANSSLARNLVIPLGWSKTQDFEKNLSLDINFNMLLKVCVYQGFNFSNKKGRMKLREIEGSWIGEGSIFY